MKRTLQVLLLACVVVEIKPSAFGFRLQFDVVSKLNLIPILSDPPRLVDLGTLFDLLRSLPGNPKQAIARRELHVLFECDEHLAVEDAHD